MDRTSRSFPPQQPDNSLKQLYSLRQDRNPNWSLPLLLILKWGQSHSDQRQGKFNKIARGFLFISVSFQWRENLFHVVWKSPQRSTKIKALHISDPNSCVCCGISLTFGLCRVACPPYKLCFPTSSDSDHMNRFNVHECQRSGTKHRQDDSSCTTV